MRYEFFPTRPDQRFHKRSDSTIVGLHGNADQMSPDSALNADEPLLPDDGQARPRAADHLWRPWYAKLWWAAIPIYWAGMAASSLKIELMLELYTNAFAGLLNVVFFPMTALMVLGIGYARAMIDYLVDRSAPGEPGDHEFDPTRRVGAPPPGFDPLDPRSGNLWIGNPLNALRQHQRH